MAPKRPATNVGTADLPYIVLAMYKPWWWPKAPKETCEEIGNDLCFITHNAGLTPLHDGVLEAQDWCPWVNMDRHAEVKRYTPDYFKSEDWHQDGDLDPGSNMDHALVLWTTKYPTELRTDEGICQANPFEVILFRNLRLSHRRPLAAPRGGERHFFRQRVNLPTHIKLP